MMRLSSRAVDELAQHTGSRDIRLWPRQSPVKHRILWMYSSIGHVGLLFDGLKQRKEMVGKLLYAARTRCGIVLSAAGLNTVLVLGP